MAQPSGDIVLVTGSNGRIGTAVMERLRGRFDNVVGFDQKAEAPPPPECVRIAVDISSDESVQAGLRMLLEHHGKRIATVVHLAAYYDFLGKESPKYEDITVKGTERLLRGLRKDFEVGQFIFSSTMLVHKPGEPGQFINEDWPLEPTWAYPKSKVKTEAAIQAGRGPVPAVMLRIAGVYDDGCHSPPLSHQIQRIYERQLEAHLYSGSTSHGQAFIHMDDLVDSIELAIDRRATLPPDVAILIGEPEALSYDELQHTFARLIHNESWETIAVPAVIAKPGAWVQDHLPGKESFIKPWMIDRANDQYSLDITRARTLLGWNPSRTLRQSMPKMIEALKADPAGWYREHGLELPASLAGKASPPPNKLADHTSHPGPGADPSAAKPVAPVAAGAGNATYTCPMHPEVRQSSPGNCPRCGMTLEVARSAAKAPETI